MVSERRTTCQVSKFMMAKRNLGGRPPNAWTSSLERKLTRMDILSQTKIKAIPEILSRAEGFKTSKRNVQYRLSALNAQDMRASHRRQRKLFSRAKLKTTAAQIKPRAVEGHIAGQSRYNVAIFHANGGRGDVVIEDEFYNPLAHWDYFSEVAIVEPQHTVLCNNDGVSKRYMIGMRDTNRFRNAQKKKDSRKTKLRSLITGSELSFVVSLLDSRWSKSSLHTKMLSDTSMTDGVCEQLYDTSKPNNSEINEYDMCSVLFKRLQSQPPIIALSWRPCCGLNGNLYGSTWTCQSRGFSAALQQARSIYKPCVYQDISGIFVIDILFELLNYIESDPILSGPPPFFYSVETAITESNTADFIHGMALSSESYHIGHVMEQGCSDIDQFHNDDRVQMIGFSDSELRTTDYFGNTALHHAAASRNFDSIMLLLNKGLPAEVLNTSGQTFMHLLDGRGPIARYMEVLRRLMREPRGFPFLLKDNYGFSIASLFFSTTDIEAISPEHLSEINSVLGAPHPRDMELDFSLRFEKVACKEWATGDADLATTLDKNWDTVLIAILKKWPGTGSETTLVQLINQLTSNRESKANVNAYDFDGNTAVAVAASKGLCSAVERLLDLGANPNSRNWARMSVLAHASVYLHAARKSCNNELYTKILICEKILVMRGAKKEVTVYQEFGSEITEPPRFQRSMSGQAPADRQDILEESIMAMLPDVKECSGHHHEMSESTFICFHCGYYGQPSSTKEDSRPLIFGNLRPISPAFSMKENYGPGRSEFVNPRDCSSDGWLGVRPKNREEC